MLDEPWIGAEVFEFSNLDSSFKPIDSFDVGERVTRVL